jgi:hypothetical protein
MRNVRMALAALTGVTLSLGGFASAAHADPPGNNGTIKIDAEAFDTHPDNEPHVGCQFQVDFYGFDQGNLNADVEFVVHPPTGKDVVLLDDTVAIGQDAAGGGTDLDAERTYDLSSALASMTPHPQQGFHVKLTVHADGSQGADTKHKVFWVQRCDTYPNT